MLLTTPWTTASPSGMRNEEDIALDRTLVFHYDPVHNIVIKEEMPPLTAEEEEALQQRLQHPKRKRA